MQKCGNFLILKNEAKCGSQRKNSTERLEDENLINMYMCIYIYIYIYIYILYIHIYVCVKNCNIHTDG